jgi:tRNA uridine 5-carbamoylmethylation protein Kti12
LINHGKVYCFQMPLVVITGIPCSGKTTRAKELKQFFEDRGKEVHVVSENEQLVKANFQKNQFYAGKYELNAFKAEYILCKTVQIRHGRNTFVVY